jgi:hypothetical protein
MAARVVPSAPLSVIESAYEILIGEIMTFSFSPVLFSTCLKISKANELPDSIRATWSCERLMGTGSVGNSSLFLVHDIAKSVIMTKIAADDLIVLLFIVV